MLPTITQAIEVEEVVALGHPISVPVGPKTLGRVFNVLGLVIDNKEEIPDAPRHSIHRLAPDLEEQQQACKESTLR